MCMQIVVYSNVVLKLIWNGCRTERGECDRQLAHGTRHTAAAAAADSDTCVGRDEAAREGPTESPGRPSHTHTARESVLNQITQFVNPAPEIGSNVDTLD